MRKWIVFFSAIALAVTALWILAAEPDPDWDRTVLPRPPEQFQGVTKRTLEGSKAAFTEPVKAPAGAPNLLLVLGSLRSARRFTPSVISAAWAPG